MKEYIFNVIVEGEEDILKTWSNNVHSAIDNMICMAVIDDIISIEEIETSKSWEFNGDFDHLRDLRNNLNINYNQLNIEGF
jgi:hypothetical protein